MRGSASSATHEHTPSRTSEMLDVGDLDGAGRDDLVCSASSGSVVVVSW